MRRRQSLVGRVASAALKALRRSVRRKSLETLRLSAGRAGNLLRLGLLLQTLFNDLYRFLAWDMFRTIAQVLDHSLAHAFGNLALGVDRSRFPHDAFIDDLLTCHTDLGFV